MYGELMVGLNMLFNFTILSFANNLQRRQVHLGRLLFASFIGALMIVIMSSTLPSLFIVFISMTIIAYGTNFFTWRKLALTFLLGAIFAGGLLTLIQEKLIHFERHGYVLAACAFLYMVLAIVKKKMTEVRTVAQTASLTKESTLSLWDTQIPLTIFIDSGNQCEEPISGKPVQFISYAAVQQYMPIVLQQFYAEWDDGKTPFTVTPPAQFRHHLRYIKMVTVQGEKWVMGLQYKEWVIQDSGPLMDGYIVFTMNKQHYPNDADAILHVSVMQDLS